MWKFMKPTPKKDVTDLNATPLIAPSRNSVDVVVILDTPATEASPSDVTSVPKSACSDAEVVSGECIRNERIVDEAIGMAPRDMQQKFTSEMSGAPLGKTTCTTDAVEAADVPKAASAEPAVAPTRMHGIFAGTAHRTTPAAKPAGNPYGAKTPVSSKSAKPTANPFGAKTPVNPFGNRTASNPFGARTDGGVAPARSAAPQQVVELLDTPAAKISHPSLSSAEKTKETPSKAPIKSAKTTKTTSIQRAAKAGDKPRPSAPPSASTVAPVLTVAPSCNATPGVAPACIFMKRESKEEARARLQKEQEEKARVEAERLRVEQEERAAAAEREKRRKAEELMAKFQMTMLQSKRDAEAMFKSGEVVDLSGDGGSASKRRRGRSSGPDSDSDGEAAPARAVSEKAKSTTTAPLNTGFFAPKRSVSSSASLGSSSADGSSSSGSSTACSVLDSNCSIPFPLVTPVPAFFSFKRESALFDIEVSPSPPSPGVGCGVAGSSSGFWVHSGASGSSGQCCLREQYVLPASEEPVRLFDVSKSDRFAVGRVPTDVSVDWVRGDICSYKASSNWSLFWRSLVSHYYGRPTSNTQVHSISETEDMSSVAKAIDRLRHPSKIDQFSTCFLDYAFVNTRKQDAPALSDATNTQFSVILSWLSSRATKARLPGGAAHNMGKVSSSLSSRRPAARGGGAARRRDRWGDSESEEDEEGEEVTADSNNILVIQGPHSSGKSSVVYACAEQLKYNVIEINASQCRSHDEIKRICREAMQSRGLNFADASAAAAAALAAKAASAKGNGKGGKVKGTVIDSRKSKSGRGRTKTILRDEDEEEEEESQEVKIIEPVAVVRKDLNLILFEDVDILFEGEDFGFHNAILSLMKDAKCPVILTCTKWGGHGVSGQNDPARFALDRLIKGLHKDNVPLIVHLQGVAAPSHCSYGRLLERELANVVDAPTLAAIASKVPLPSLIDLLVTYSYNDIRGLLQSLAVLLLGTDASCTTLDREDLSDTFEQSLRHHWRLDFTYMDHLHEVLCGRNGEARENSLAIESEVLSTGTRNLALLRPSVREVEPRICKSVGGHVVTVHGSKFQQPQFSSASDEVCFAVVSVYLRCAGSGDYTDVAVPDAQVRVLSDRRLQFMLPPLDDFGLYTVVVEVANSSRSVWHRSDGVSRMLALAAYSWSVSDGANDLQGDMCFDSICGRSTQEPTGTEGAFIIAVDYEFAAGHQLLLGSSDAQLAHCLTSIAASKDGTTNSTYLAARQFHRQRLEELKASGSSMSAQPPTVGRRGRRKGPSPKIRRARSLTEAEEEAAAAAAGEEDATAGCAEVALSEGMDADGSGDEAAGEAEAEAEEPSASADEQEGDDDDDFDDQPAPAAAVAEVTALDSERMDTDGTDADRWIVELPESATGDVATADRFVITPTAQSQAAVAADLCGLESMARMLDAWSDGDVLGAHMSSLYHDSLLQECAETAGVVEDVQQVPLSRSASSASLGSEDCRPGRSESIGELADLFSSKTPALTQFPSASGRSCPLSRCVSVHYCSSPSSYGPSLLAGGDVHGSSSLECERDLSLCADLGAALRDLAVHDFSAQTKHIPGFLMPGTDSATRAAAHSVDLTRTDDDALFEDVDADSQFAGGNSFLALYAKFHGHGSVSSYMDFIKIRHEFRDFLHKNILYTGAAGGPAELQSAQSKFLKPLHGNRTDLTHSLFCATIPYLGLIMKAEEIAYHHYADYRRRRSGAGANGGDEEEEEFDDDLYAVSYGAGMSFLPLGIGGRLSGSRSSSRSTRSAGKSQEPHRFPYTTSCILPTSTPAQLECLLYAYCLSLY